MWFQLMRTIMTQPWAIEPSYVDSVLPFLSALLNGDQPEWKQETGFSVYSIDARGRNSSTDSGIKPGSVAIVTMQGPMMKNDQFCGPSGTASIGQQLKELAANPNVDGIVLQIDSPGGTVDGTEELSRIYGSIKKPKVTFVDGLMASAGMWVGSAGDEIILNGETAMVGSIGTMASFADVKPVLEKAGVKFHNIKATKSVDKNAHFDSVVAKGEYDGYRKSMLDPLNNVFLSSIEKNRAGKIDLVKEDVLTGKVYIGKSAINAGLADRIGTLDDAINAVRSMASNNHQQKASMTLKSKYPKTSAVAGFAENAEAMDNGGVELSASEMQAVENHIASNSGAAELATRVTALTKERDDANASLSTANDNLVKMTTERDNLQAKVVTLGGKTDPPKETSKAADNNTDGRPKVLNSMDRLAEEHGLGRY